MPSLPCSPVAITSGITSNATPRSRRSAQWEAKAFEMLSRGYDPGHLALAFMEQFVANSYGEPERGITNASSVDKLSETDPPM